MRILLDCDGILADFATPYLELIEQLTGFQYNTENLTNVEFLKGLDLECIDKDIRKLVYKKGYCRNIPVYEGAKKGVKMLQEIGEVVIVTSPMVGGPYWMFERAEWLNTHFGIKKENLIFATKKECVRGDIFVDDHPNMYEKWNKENGPKSMICKYYGSYETIPSNENGKAFMWERPWNKNAKGEKISSWLEIIKYCSKHSSVNSINKINK